MNTTPIRYKSTSRFPNYKYRISIMLTHFFSLQKVIPRRIQQKYFNMIRDKLLARISIIKSRAEKKLNGTRTRKLSSISRTNDIVSIWEFIPLVIFARQKNQPLTLFIIHNFVARLPVLLLCHKIDALVSPTKKTWLATNYSIHVELLQMAP